MQSGLNRGFLLKDKGYKDGRDYIVVIDNRRTKTKDDDKLITIIPVKVAYDVVI